MDATLLGRRPPGEASFADELDGQGRPRYGNGKRLAQDAQLEIAHDKRAREFIDPKLGSAKFRDECEKWISRHADAELTKEAYQGILRAHVGPVLGDRTIAAVAGEARYRLALPDLEDLAGAAGAEAVALFADRARSGPWRGDRRRCGAFRLPGPVSERRRTYDVLAAR